MHREIQAGARLKVEVAKILHTIEPMRVVCSISQRVQGQAGGSAWIRALRPSVTFYVQARDEPRLRAHTWRPDGSGR